MIKIFHEAPKSIFTAVQNYTAGDYALVHLFEEDPEYFNLFKKAVEVGREVILDNSIFELGKAFDPERFLYWINELKPTYYIVPDVLENSTETRSNVENWISKYKDRVTCDAKIIGVVQGSTYENLVACYEYMSKNPAVDKIAISFDYSYYQKSFPHANKYAAWMLGRVKFLSDLVEDGIINYDKPHHLLGVALPAEGMFYRDVEEYRFLDSIDTSNPVVHGWKGIEYEGSVGPTTKDPTKLYTIINEEVQLHQWKSIRHNIESFDEIWNGLICRTRRD